MGKLEREIKELVFNPFSNFHTSPKEQFKRIQEVINEMRNEFPVIKTCDLSDKSWYEIAIEAELKTIERKEWYDKWLKK